MVIAVDFDGTIVENKYPEIGQERPFAIETLKMLIAATAWSSGPVARANSSTLPLSGAASAAWSSMQPTATILRRPPTTTPTSPVS